MKKVIVLISVLCIFCLLNGQTIGRQDVVGYTTYDWQMGGPMSTRCRTDSVCNGIHVCWVASNFNPGVDRNQGYNYYNFTTRQWHWSAGMNIYTQRSGFGNLDYDPITGVAVAITQQSVTGNIRIVAAKDASLGAGIFDYCIGPLDYGDAVISVSNNQAVHCVMMGSFPNDSLLYARVQPWCTWTTPINIGYPTLTGFHSQNIAASKISNKVVIVWMCADDPYPQRAFYRLSNDGGINWEAPIQLPYPNAQGMTPSFTISGFFAMFDNQDNLHIVTSISDTGRTVPAAIWHFCPINNPSWSLVHYYAPETLIAPVGYNAIFVTRPSIVQAMNSNYFYVVWEQFDSLNYEPTTNLARADIRVAELRNNGQTVYAKGRFTQPNTTSKRFPCIGGVFNDTIVVSYMIDSIAGFSIFGEGRTTLNPIVCHFFHVRTFYSPIQEQPMFELIKPTLHASPNPFSSFSVIRYSIPVAEKVSLQLYNTSGRLAKTLIDEYKNPGNYSVTLNSKSLPCGIYFCKLETEDKIITKKIVKTK